MNSERINTSKIVSGGDTFTRTTAPGPSDLENRVLRQAVQDNLVSFPSQVPVFGRHSRADLQHKIVILYFVRGLPMEDIAKRYGLRRQRMGQILTSWRSQAMKEGYVQAIDPEHTVFKRVRLEPITQPTEMRVDSGPLCARAAENAPSHPVPIIDALEVDKSRPVVPGVIERRVSSLAEELHTIVDILDNQLQLCAKPLGANIYSCEPLIGRAKMLCARLEADKPSHPKADWRAIAAISAAKECFQRFQQAMDHSAVLPSPCLSGSMTNGSMTNAAG